MASSCSGCTDVLWERFEWQQSNWQRNSCVGDDALVGGVAACDRRQQPVPRRARTCGGGLCVSSCMSQAFLGLTQLRLHPPPPHCLHRCCAGLVTGPVVYRLLCRNFGSWGCSEHGCLLQSVQGVVVYRVEHLVPSRMGLGWHVCRIECGAQPLLSDGEGWIATTGAGWNEC